MIIFLTILAAWLILGFFGARMFLYDLEYDRKQHIQNSDTPGMAWIIFVLGPIGWGFIMKYADSPEIKYRGHFLPVPKELGNKQPFIAKLFLTRAFVPEKPSIQQEIAEREQELQIGK